jgi:hypothetical protein
MSSLLVNAIATEPSGNGAHEHIRQVRASATGGAFDGIWVSRATVVRDLRTGGDAYYTEAGGSRAAIKVVQCPLCSYSHYLRSERDTTTADNLLSLPRS